MLASRLFLVVCLAVGLASPCLSQVLFQERASAANVNQFHAPGPNYIAVNGAMAPVAFVTVGGAVGDFNRDGKQDLFVISGGTTPDHLYINQGNGQFVDEADAWGLNDLHMGAAAAVGDINGDGWLDIFVTSNGDASGLMSPNSNKLYKNVGGTGFVELVNAGVSWNDDVPNAYGAAFGDYDLDGDLDLMVAGWEIGAGSVGGNRLFRNNGDETFTDVTAAANLLELGVYGFAPRFVDMDGDRYPELLLTADFETARYYVNNGDGTFTDSTVTSGTGLDCNAMGQTVGDFNNDGMMDWYVSNIFLELEPVRRCGNMLYINQGGHTYSETADASGVIDGRWGWGTVAVDIDHDGFLDIVEVNGWTDAVGGPQFFSNQPARVFMNQGDSTFADVAAGAGFTHTGQGRGLANFDYDNDGDQDFVIFSTSERLELYRNDSVNSNHWLRVFLDTSNNPAIAPDGFGTRLVAKCGVEEYVRIIDGGSNYMSQSELSAHFGIGACTSIDELRVEWPNDVVTIYDGIPHDRTVTLDAPPPGTPAGTTLMLTFTLGVPTVSTWGQVIFCCLILTCGTIIFRRQPQNDDTLARA